MESKQFVRWAISYLSGSGYDYKSVDIKSYYDETLSLEENKQLIKRIYPSKPGQETQMDESQAEGVQAYQAAAEGRKEAKREFAEKEIAKSTQVKRDYTPDSEEVSEDINAFEEAEEKKSSGFLDKVKGAYDEYKTGREEKKEIKEKERKFKSEQRIKELDAEAEKLSLEKEVRDKEYLTTKEKIIGLKEKVTGGPAARAFKEETGIGMGQKQDVNLFGTTPLRQRESQRRNERTFIDQRNLLASAEPQKGRSQAGDRYGLDVFNRQPGQRRDSPILKNADVLAARKEKKKQKYGYRTVIEKGVARRERVPVKNEEEEVQQNPLAKFDVGTKRQEPQTMRRPKEPARQEPNRFTLSNILGTRKPTESKPRKEIDFFGKASPGKKGKSRALKEIDFFGKKKVNFVGKVKTKKKKTKRKKGRKK